MKYEINRKKDVLGPHNIDVLSVLFGTMLGDGFGEKRSGKSRVHFQQESSNREYLHWLHSFFASRGYCNWIKPKMSLRICKGGKKRWILRMRTYSFSSFNSMIDSFYCQETKKKKIPQQDQLIIFLTPLALAIWACDDGAKSGRGFKISTNSFSRVEIQVVCDFLFNRYGIISKPNRTGFAKHTNDVQYCLYIHSVSKVKFVNLIKPFIVPSMHYKFL